MSRGGGSPSPSRARPIPWHAGRARALVAILAALACRSGEAPAEADERASALPDPAEPIAAKGDGASSAPDPAPPIPWGRYRGESTCLELFANGDGHLNLVDASPKIQVLGRMKLEPAAEAPWLDLHFEVERIWGARWMSPCRKNHEFGDWREEAFVLGRRFAAGTQSLRLRLLDDAAIELCAETCERLERQPTVLHGRWRRSDFQVGEASQRPPGEVLDLEVDERGGAWLSAGPDAPWVMLSGTMRVRAIDPGRLPDAFELELEVARVEERGTIEAHDSTWSAGSVLTLQVRRLAGEALEVCPRGTGEAACSTLDRMFDASAYELD